MALDTYREELEATAAALSRPGSGLLAADESTGTIGKRFAAIGLETVRSTAALIALCWPPPLASANGSVA